MVTATQPVAHRPIQPATRPSAGKLSEPPPSSPDLRRPDAQRLTLAAKVTIGFLALVTCALGVLGGMGSFTTLRDLGAPWFGGMAWIAPVGIDIGIFALLAWDLLNEYLQVPWPALRWVAWAFIAGTIFLNVAAAHGSITGSVFHAAMPALFVTVAEGIRHLIRHWIGLSQGTLIERIPRTRWLLAPFSSALLYRRMILWNVTSYRQALVLEHRRLLAIARLQAQYGRLCWRWRAPLTERLSLRFEWTGLAFDWDDEPQRAEIPDDPDRVLVTAAAGILQDANLRGESVSQITLAKKLRELGHRVANDRLSWLVTAAQAQLIPTNDGTR